MRKNKIWLLHKFPIIISVFIVKVQHTHINLLRGQNHINFARTHNCSITVCSLTSVTLSTPIFWSKKGYCNQANMLEGLTSVFAVHSNV